MKSIEQIALEFANETLAKNIFKGKAGLHKTYYDISGFLKGKDYFNVYFIETENKKEIRISPSTINTKTILKIIKKIEPESKVTYTKIIKKEVTV